MSTTEQNLDSTDREQPLRTPEDLCRFTQMSEKAIRALVEAGMSPTPTAVGSELWFWQAHIDERVDRLSRVQEEKRKIAALARAPRGQRIRHRDQTEHTAVR